MLVEGKGLVAPAPVPIRLSHHDYQCILTIAVEREAFRRYSNKPAEWSRGLIGDGSWLASLPRGIRPIVIGLAGEYAAGTYLNAPIDTMLRKRGDGGIDLTVGDYRMQVKTRSKAGKRSLVRRVDHHRQMVPLTKHLVFAEWTGGVEVMLLGWIERNDLNLLRQSPVSVHYNLVVKDVELRPMQRLRNLVKEDGHAH